MRKIITISLITLSFMFSCDDMAKQLEKSKVSTDIVHNPNTASSELMENKLPVLEIKEDIFDFGTIMQGESVSHEFKLKNIGNGPLLISSAKGSCGCTVPEWPQDPIGPGEQANIKVTFDSKGKIGKQAKRVTLMTNAIPNVKILTIKGNIVQ